MELMLTRPPGAVDHWFRLLASQLLAGCRLVAGADTFRIIELEIYYQSADHPDPFVHAQPMQLHRGRWYFHRTGGSYRSGSFKGVDLTFGDGTAFGGVLLRGLVDSADEVIDGPSLLVDRLLKATGHAKVSALDAAINGRDVTDVTSPVHLKLVDPGVVSIVSSPRVGLNAEDDRVKLAYVDRPYRFLTEPGRTKKGRRQTILGLHTMGRTIEEIARLTGSPKSAVARHVARDVAGGESGD